MNRCTPSLCFPDLYFFNFHALSRLVSLCSCQAVSTKKEAGENKTERLTLPGRTLLHSCCFSVYPDPMWRKTSPPENRLQSPPPPPPCLAGFFIIIWAAHAKQAIPSLIPSVTPLNLALSVGHTKVCMMRRCNMPPTQRETKNKSVRVWVDFVLLRFVWKYTHWTLH